MLYFLYSIKRIVPVVFISFLICLANLSANKFIAFIFLFVYFCLLPLIFFCWFYEYIRLIFLGPFSICLLQKLIFTNFNPERIDARAGQRWSEASVACSSGQGAALCHLSPIRIGEVRLPTGGEGRSDSAERPSVAVPEYWRSKYCPPKGLATVWPRIGMNEEKEAFDCSGSLNFLSWLSGKICYYIQSI